MRALLALAERRLEEGAYEEVSAAARQVLAAAPAEERAHRLLMVACLEQGLRAQAVRQYERCRAALAEELGIGPGPETARLYRLAVQALPDAPARPGTTVAVAEAALSSVARTAGGGTLYGREELLRTVVTATDRPVALLSGEAGIGKTRLAGQAAVRLAEEGATVLWGAAHDAEGHMPYGPFVAVAGGTAPLSEVLEIARDLLHPPMRTAEAIAAPEEAVSASLLVEQRVGVAGRSVTGLAFRHPLLRLTCYDLLPRLRSLGLHTAWSETLLHHRPDDVDVLAWHLLRAEGPRAADHLRRAAERAAALYANEEAEEYYRRLVLLVGDDPVRAAGVGMDHGALLLRMSRYGDAADVLRAALDEAGRAEDADTAVAVTAPRTPSRLWPGSG